MRCIEQEVGDTPVFAAGVRACTYTCTYLSMFASTVAEFHLIKGK